MLLDPVTLAPALLALPAPAETGDTPAITPFVITHLFDPASGALVTPDVPPDRGSVDLLARTTLLRWVSRELEGAAQRGDRIVVLRIGVPDPEGVAGGDASEEFPLEGARCIARLLASSTSVTRYRLGVAREGALAVAAVVPEQAWRSPWDAAAGVIERQLARQLVAGLSETWRFVTGARVGFCAGAVSSALVPQAGIEPGTMSAVLMNNAGRAMRRAREAGPGRVVVFNAAVEERAAAAAGVVEMVRGALAENRVFGVYQPKVDLATGQVIGVELLARIRDDAANRIIYPGEFLWAIEDDDTILQLGRRTIAAAIAHYREWCKQGVDLPLSINLGARQIASQGFAARVLEAMRIHELPRGALRFEILETVPFANVEQVRSVILELREKGGCQFYLDDFGTGHASVQHLRAMPVDAIKIDRSFITNLPTNATDRVIVESFCRIAQAFQVAVIAEGVEDEAAAERLMGLGCRYAQGYGIARPMPAEEVVAWTRRWEARPEILSAAA